MRLPRFARPRTDGRSPVGEAEPRSTDRWARERAAMVDVQLEARGIRDPELLRAFRIVPRHGFVEGDDPYGDHAMPVGSGQTISQPYVVARMTESARPPEGWDGARVLEIGTGSGYQAAILAELGAHVTTIERHEELAAGARDRLAAAGYDDDRVHIVVGDGTEGWEAGAPYRSILVTAGGPSVPQPLVEQLDRSGGRLIMPVGDRTHQTLTLIERNGDELQRTALEPVVFVPLVGRYGLPDG
jgi:protein-L-isoaspartate(D-aspartate) O-methyltransferase